jgi:hypothetical protein
MLSNPIYGGAYAYGKTEHTVRYEAGEPRPSSRRRPRGEWVALIPDAHEGYVSWDEFERIQHTMAENRRGAGRRGAATNGSALLAGLLRCRRCGRKLTVWYTGNAHTVLRYACRQGALDYGEPRCISFGGVPVDEAMAKELLRVVQPAAIEAAIVASEAAAHQQDEVLKAWTRELEAAQYAARRAQRQYDAIGGMRPYSASARLRRVSISTYRAAIRSWSPVEKNSNIWPRTSRRSGAVRMRISV